MSQEEAGRIARMAERARRGARVPLKVALPTVAALGAGAAVAVGSIPGSDGTITGCYDTVPLYQTGTSGQDSTVPYGTLRVIDPSNTTVTESQSGTTTVPSEVTSCSPNEATLTWNQKGPPGPQGAKGDQGDKGDKGDKGDSGGLTGDTSYEISAGHGTALFLKISGLAGPTNTKITSVGGWSRVNNVATAKGAIAQASAVGKSQGFGASTQKQDGVIDLKSFALGSETPGLNIGSQSSGAGAGKVNIQTFEFVKSVDKTSPLLYKDLISSTVIRSAEVIVTHVAKGEQTQVAGYKFSDLIIRSLSDQGTTETVTGVFKAVETQLGSGKNSVSAGWNRVKNINQEATVVPGS